MTDAYTDLLIHIRNRIDEQSPYPVEASLSDGSFFFGHMQLDEEALRQKELDLEQEAYGKLLFEALLAGPIGRAYDLAMGIARDQSQGRLRVRLWLDNNAPRLHVVKWERLYHYHDGQLMPLGTTAQTPFSRYTGLGIAEPPPIKQRPIRLLVAIANPKDLSSKYSLEPIDVTSEVNNLRQAFGNLQNNQQLQVTIMPGQSGLPDELRAELEAEGYLIEDRRTTVGNLLRRTGAYHAYHFLGHGAYRQKEGAETGTAVLYMEKLDGNCALVKDEELVDVLRAADQLPQLLFLAACESAKTEIGQAFVGLAPKLVQAGVPAVVAMQDKIAIEAARQLTGDFYARLLQHGLVDRALNEARNFLYQHETGSWATSVLFMRLKTGQLFTADPYQTALEAMSRYEKFTFFSQESGRYVPLPIEVIHLTGAQDYSNLGRLEQQATATIEVLKAVEETLASRTEESSDQRPKLVALLGGFGTNKSTQLKRLAWATIEESLADPGRRRLPVYVDLQSYQPVRSSLENPLEGCVLEALGQFWPDLTAARLSELPTKHTLRLLLYGMDSLASPDRTVAVEQLLTLIKEYPQHEYVLASRPAAINWSDLHQELSLHLLVIQPLNPTKIRQFLENLDRVSTMGRTSEAARRQIGKRLLKEIYRSQLFDLAATPRFMFEMLQQAQRGLYPNSRTDALRKWVEDAIALIALGQGMRAHAAETIYALAWEMQIARRVVWPVSEAFRIMDGVRGSRGYNLETLYGNYIDHDLLDEVGERSLRFTYPAVQAYCCAKAIMTKSDRERILSDITSMLGMPERLRWWEETLVFICGMLSEEDDLKALQNLLANIVYNVNLLQGQQVFLAARCMLECQKHRRDLAEIHQHVINALSWRTDSQNEPRTVYRVTATQLLSRLADPEAVIDLAELVYEKARRNLSNAADYEYSSVRMAAAIGLKRMKSRQKVDETLAAINPQLVDLFHNWEQGDSDALLRQFNETDDIGVQAIATLALGDLASQSALSLIQNDRKDVLGFLIEVFNKEDTPTPVRWAVTDALAMSDPTTVTAGVIKPALEQLKGRNGEQADWLDRDKSLAYLIGLIRSQEPEAHAFLIDHCLAKTADLRLWLTAIDALGRLANLEDRQLLVNIAAGSLDGRPLEEFFSEASDLIHLRKKAIEVLAEIGDEKTVQAMHAAAVDRDERLAWTFYQATGDIYQRIE